MSVAYRFLLALLLVFAWCRIRGLPLWQGMARGILYGALSALDIGIASGNTLNFQASSAYVLSLAYLALLGYIASFASYLTLLNRTGAARAGYIGVMVPIDALLL